MRANLESWTDGGAKRAIVDFVTSVTTAGGPDFVPPASRIATFDNDGTLWLEKPLYIQLQHGLRAIGKAAAEKPELRAIGRRPIMAAGNSDGDIHMLKYAKGGSGPSLALLVRHDDAEREYAYDGGTEKALQLAPQESWVVVSMKSDWKTVFGD